VLHIKPDRYGRNRSLLFWLQRPSFYLSDDVPKVRILASCHLPLIIRVGLWNPRTLAPTQAKTDHFLQACRGLGDTSLMSEGPGL
jgi:hypothetical protein